MIATARSILAALLVAAFGTVLLVSCATSSGAGLSKVAAHEGSAPPPEKPPAEPPESKQGLEIVTDPDRVEIWVDGNYKGLTPFIVDDITQGWHRITLRRTGYREVTTWLQFTSSYMLYQTSLTQITGFLRVEVSPPGALVTVGDIPVSPGLRELPVGDYTLLARAFGYADYAEGITISEKAVTDVSITLQPTAFEITSLSVPRPIVNPDNPGVLGTTEVRFSVTGPGAGRLEILDVQSNVVFSAELPKFTTWDQSFRWNLRDEKGSAVPDGEYRVSISAQGDDGVASSREAELRVDRTVKVAPRVVWSGSSGLLYAPVAEVLPPGDFQTSIILAAASEGALVRAPIVIGLRVGIGDRLEIDASGGIIPSSNDIPFLLGAAVRWNFLSPTGEYGLEAALEGKFSFQYDASPSVNYILSTDTLANFTGVSVAVPLQLTLGRVSLLGSPGVTVSPWYPYGGSLSAGFFAWLYLRTGVLLDLGQVTAGISATARTQPLPAGFTALGPSFPVQAAAEVHWLVPGSQILVSALVAGEFDSLSTWYLMGGGGLGFLY